MQENKKKSIGVFNVSSGEQLWNKQGPTNKFTSFLNIPTNKSTSYFISYLILE